MGTAQCFRAATRFPQLPVATRCTIMSIDIRIHIELTDRQKRVMRAGVVTGTVIGALGLGIAIAQPINTSWIAQNAPVSASSLAGNLTGLQSQITTLQEQIASLQAFQTQATQDGGYTLGAVFCGTTDSHGVTGSFGYSGAAALCQKVTGCSPTGAHMCSSEEIARTLGMGRPIALDNSSWYSTATLVPDPSSNENIDDCQGWTVATLPDVGACWGSTGPGQAGCSVALPIMCCN